MINYLFFQYILTTQMTQTTHMCSMSSFMIRIIQTVYVRYMMSSECWGNCRKHAWNFYLISKVLKCLKHSIKSYVWKLKQLHAQVLKQSSESIGLYTSKNNISKYLAIVILSNNRVKHINIFPFFFSNEMKIKQYNSNI